MKQVFTSWGKKEQSKPLPTIKMIAERLQHLDPAQISQSGKHPQRKKSHKR